MCPMMSCDWIKSSPFTLKALNMTQLGAVHGSGIERPGIGRGEGAF